MNIFPVAANLERAKHAKLDVASHAATLAPSTNAVRAAVIDSLPDRRTFAVARTESLVRHQEGRVRAIRMGLAAVALLAALSVATAARAVPDQDSAVGTIKRLTRAGLPTTVHVNATSGSQGEDAQGTFWTIIEHPTLGELSFRGRVACLAVDGNRAAVRGTVDVSTDPDIAVGSEFQIEMTDNGSPGAGSDTAIGYFGFVNGEGCPDFFGLVPEVTILEGNFTVSDN